MASLLHRFFGQTRTSTSQRCKVTPNLPAKFEMLENRRLFCGGVEHASAEPAVAAAAEQVVLFVVPEGTPVDLPGDNGPGSPGALIRVTGKTLGTTEAGDCIIEPGQYTIQEALIINDSGHPLKVEVFFYTNEVGPFPLKPGTVLQASEPGGQCTIFDGSTGNIYDRNVATLIKGGPRNSASTAAVPSQQAISPKMHKSDQASLVDDLDELA
jgi:hypothetical protein